MEQKSTKEGDSPSPVTNKIKLACLLVIANIEVNFLLITMNLFLIIQKWVNSIKNNTVAIWVAVSL